MYYFTRVINVQKGDGGGFDKQPAVIMYSM